MSHNMSVFKKDGDSEGDSGFVTPDSTTKLPQFVEGEDVLSHGKDGLFYLGTIVMVDSENERCMVQFQDSTAHWSLYKDLAKLKLPDSADVCIICKSSNRWDTNEIILCCICQQGYHQDCVQPCIGIEYCDVESQWECPCCSKNSSKEGKEGKMSNQLGTSKRSSLPSVELQHDSKLVLPYHIKSLTWDQGHKSNREQTYCYCGGPGEWYNRMLQCQRCKQWFHEACVDCLHYSLLYGDRFYIFVCVLCNDSVEFLHRLDVKWVDVVHLAIFNLTLQDSKTYFEYEETITQWINDNWELLQCPLSLQNVPVNLRKHEVLRVLEGNRPRFKCGREIKKKTSLWGLRIRIPPPVQAFTLPHGIITYETIKQITFRNKKNRNADSPPIPRTYRIREEKQEVDENIVRFSPAKKRAMSPSVITFDDDSPKSEKIRKKRKRELDSLLEEGKDELDSGLGSRELRRHNQEEITEDSQVVNLNKQDQDKESSLQIALQDHTVTAVKRKRGRPPKNDVKSDKPRHIRDLGDLNHKRAEKILKEALKQGSGGILSRQMSVDGGLSPVSVTPSGETSGDDSSSHGTLASFIPPPSNFEGYNNPFLNLDTQWLTASPVVRIHKRKLIESDIRYDKNGDVKHRKFRRKYEKSVKVHNVGGTIGLNGCVPTGGQINDSSYIKGCDDYTVNGRVSESPIKEDCDRVNNDSKMINSALSFSDLKSSVKDFFGAANRIANGEKFNIIARRVSAHNKVQYLIEWDTPSSS